MVAAAAACLIRGRGAGAWRALFRRFGRDWHITRKMKTTVDCERSCAAAKAHSGGAQTLAVHTHAATNMYSEPWLWCTFDEYRPLVLDPSLHRWENSRCCIRLRLVPIVGRDLQVETKRERVSCRLAGRQHRRCNTSRQPHCPAPCPTAGSGGTCRWEMVLSAAVSVRSRESDVPGRVSRTLGHRWRDTRLIGSSGWRGWQTLVCGDFLQGEAKTGAGEACEECINVRCNVACCERHRGRTRGTCHRLTQLQPRIARR